MDAELCMMLYLFSQTVVPNDVMVTPGLGAVISGVISGLVVLAVTAWAWKNKKEELRHAFQNALTVELEMFRNELKKEELKFLREIFVECIKKVGVAMKICTKAKMNNVKVDFYSREFLSVNQAMEQVKLIGQKRTIVAVTAWLRIYMKCAFYKDAVDWLMSMVKLVEAGRELVISLRIELGIETDEEWLNKHLRMESEEALKSTDQLKEIDAKSASFSTGQGK